MRSSRETGSCPNASLSRFHCVAVGASEGASAPWKWVNTPSQRSRGPSSSLTCCPQRAVSRQSKPARPMPVSISTWNASGSGAAAAAAAQHSRPAMSEMVATRRAPAACATACGGSGPKTTTGRPTPSSRSAAPSAAVATPYPHGARGSSARTIRSAPRPYAFAFTIGMAAARGPAVRRSVRKFSRTASRSTSIQARDSAIFGILGKGRLT